MLEFIASEKEGGWVGGFGEMTERTEVLFMDNGEVLLMLSFAYNQCSMALE